MCIQKYTETTEITAEKPMKNIKQNINKINIFSNLKTNINDNYYDYKQTRFPFSSLRAFFLIKYNIKEVEN